jgi:hypothetical protein
MEEFLLADGGTFVVDCGASTFLPLWHYLLENNALDHLRKLTFKEAIADGRLTLMAKQRLKLFNAISSSNWTRSPMLSRECIGS